DHTGMTFYFERGKFTDSIWVYTRTVTVNAGGGEIAWAEGDIVATLATESEYAITFPAADSETHVFFEPRGSDVSVVGEGAQFVVPGRAIAPSLHTPTHSESAGTGTYGITVADPVGVATALYYHTKSGPD